MLHCSRARCSCCVLQIHTNKGQAVVAFKTPAEKRSLEHIALAMNLASTLQFLRRIPTFVRERMCEHMAYRKLNAGQTVYRVGEAPTHFFVILSGTVHVHQPNFQTEAEIAHAK